MPWKALVVPHDPGWVEQFRHEAQLILQAVAPNVVAVHHIGSIAIPGIYAKPIIDMIVEVDQIDGVDSHQTGMEALGYEGLGEYGIPGRRYFRKDGQRKTRTHHAHAFATGSRHITRHIDFRDFLIAHPEYAARYSSLKRELADAHRNDIDSYTDGKDQFIRKTELMASAWRTSRVAT